MTTRLECAQFSESVYGNGNTFDTNVWEQIKDIPGLNADGYRTAFNGFAAAAYGKLSGYDENNNPIYSEIVVSYRGSGQNHEDIGDWLTSNLAQAFDYLPDQLSNALDFYKDVFKQYQNTDIRITGHSLGGALAQLVGAVQKETPKRHKKIQLNIYLIFIF